MNLALPVLGLLGLGGFIFMKQKKFGSMPKGKRLERIKNSPHYKEGQFQNLSPTPSFTEGANYFTVMKNFFLERNEHRTPPGRVPSTKTDLHKLSSNEEVLVWFGHSSYFLQSGGRKILVDPVFSNSASPLSFTNKAFPGTNRYSAKDIPQIDYLFITHDHWDHLDLPTLKALKPKVKKVITGLGTGAHLESWSYDPAIITEMDWNENLTPEAGFFVKTVPARHFSGRGFKRNQVLWTSFVLKTPHLNIFIGGDSGYDTHFRETGKKFGPFDLAILENGQYNRHWKHIHMMPEEAYTAAQDLRTQWVLPVHNSKFALAKHPWEEPLKRITKASGKGKVKLLTPLIGEKVDLHDPSLSSSLWWEKV